MWVWERRSLFGDLRTRLCSLYNNRGKFSLWVAASFREQMGLSRHRNVSRCYMCLWRPGPSLWGAVGNTVALETWEPWPFLRRHKTTSIQDLPSPSPPLPPSTLTLPLSPANKSQSGRTLVSGGSWQRAQGRRLIRPMSLFVQVPGWKGRG